MRKNLIENPDKVAVVVQFVYRILHTKKYDELFNGNSKSHFFPSCKEGFNFLARRIIWWERSKKPLNKWYDDLNTWYVEVDDCRGTCFTVGVSYDNENFIVNTISFTYNKGGSRFDGCLPLHLR